MIQTEREYAVALFSLAEDSQTASEYLNSLETVKALFEENPDYIEFLASPAIELSERIDSIEEAFGRALPEYVVSFLKLLCENGRIRTVFDCIEEFSVLVMTHTNRTKAEISSAVALSEKQKDEICKKLEKLTGKSIDPVYIIDESLIGGVKIDVDGKTYDGSIRHRLGEIKDVMNS